MITRSGLFLFILCILASCSDDDAMAPAREKTDMVNIDAVIDFDNDETASDLRVFLRAKQSVHIDEIRMFISDVGSYAALTSEDILALDAGEYQVVQLSTTELELTPDPDILDVNGDALVHDKQYILGFAVTMKGETYVDQNFRTFTLSDVHYLSGSYIGLWNDNLYTDFGISAKLTYEHGKLSGPFYYTGAFISCCSGATDGTITIELDEDQITEFRYDQTLASFMGGQCDGLYTGEGSVFKYSVLEIEFEGSDCEGAHFGGEIRLVK